MKHVPSAKVPVKRRKRRLAEEEKILHPAGNRGLASKICKELSELKSERTNNTIRIWTKEGSLVGSDRRACNSWSQGWVWAWSTLQSKKKQTKTVEWWNDLWYAHTMEYNLAIKKKNKLLIYVTIRMNPRIMLSEKAIPKSYILCDSIFITFLKGQNYRDEQIGD